MKHLKLFEEFEEFKKDTRIVHNVKADDVVNMFDRFSDIYNAGAQFIDFDVVELTVYDSDDMTQEEINDRLDELENVIYNAHLKNEI